jgi:hypothetical protein
MKAGGEGRYDGDGDGQPPDQSRRLLMIAFRVSRPFFMISETVWMNWFCRHSLTPSGATGGPRNLL